MTTFTLDGISTATIDELLVLRVRRPLVGARRDEFVEVPGREGFWHFAEKPGGRVISVDFDLLARTFADRRAAVIALADLLESPLTLAPLIFDDEPDRFHRARLVSAPDPDEWLTHGAFSVDFMCGPYAEATAPSSSAWAAATGVPHTFTPPDTVFGVPELVLTATGGTVTSFVLEVNGETLTYGPGGFGLDPAEQLTVTTLGYALYSGPSQDPQLDGTFDPLTLDMATVSGDFGYVLPGLNSVELTYTGTATSIGTTIRWRRRYR